MQIQDLLSQVTALNKKIFNPKSWVKDIYECVWAELASKQALLEAVLEDSNLILQLEAMVTLRELKLMLEYHQQQTLLPEDYVFYSFVNFLTNRWHRLQGTNLVYPHQPHYVINQISLKIATLLSQHSSSSKYQLLMPSLVSTRNHVAFESVDDLGLHQFILSDDNSRLIDVATCFMGYKVEGKFMHTTLRNAQATVDCLTDKEKERVIEHSAITKKYYKNINEWKEMLHTDLSYGAALKRLSVSLYNGSAARAGNEFNAAGTANIGLVKFSYYLSKLSEPEKRYLFSFTTQDGKTFGSIWFGRLAIKNTHNQLNTDFCVGVSANMIENILGRYSRLFCEYPLFYANNGSYEKQRLHQAVDETVLQKAFAVEYYLVTARYPQKDINYSHLLSKIAILGVEQRKKLINTAERFRTIVFLMPREEQQLEFLSCLQPEHLNLLIRNELQYRLIHCALSPAASKYLEVLLGSKRVADILRGPAEINPRQMNDEIDRIVLDPERWELAIDFYQERIKIFQQYIQAKKINKLWRALKYFKDDRYLPELNNVMHNLFWEKFFVEQHAVIMVLEAMDAFIQQHTSANALEQFPYAIHAYCLEYIATMVQRRKNRALMVLPEYFCMNLSADDYHEIWQQAEGLQKAMLYSKFELYKKFFTETDDLNIYKKTAAQTLKKWMVKLRDEQYARPDSFLPYFAKKIRGKLNLLLDGFTVIDELQRSEDLNAIINGERKYLERSEDEGYKPGSSNARIKHLPLSYLRDNEKNTLLHYLVKEYYQLSYELDDQYGKEFLELLRFFYHSGATPLSRNQHGQDCFDYAEIQFGQGEQYTLRKQWKLLSLTLECAPGWSMLSKRASAKLVTYCNKKHDALMSSWLAQLWSRLTSYCRDETPEQILGVYRIAKMLWLSPEGLNDGGFAEFLKKQMQTLKPWSLFNHSSLREINRTLIAAIKQEKISLVKTSSLDNFMHDLVTKKINDPMIERYGIETAARRRIEEFIGSFPQEQLREEEIKTQTEAQEQRLKLDDKADSKKLIGRIPPAWLKKDPIREHPETEPLLKNRYKL